MQSQGHTRVGKRADTFGHQWHHNIAHIQT